MANKTGPVSVRETERKYVLQPGQALPAPDALPGTPHGDAVDHLTARYFDTADLRLLRLGLTLRRREGGHDAGWHLKVPTGASSGGARSRDEVRLPLDAGITPPPALTRLLAGVVRGGRLIPVAQIRTERHRHELVDDAGHQQAEVVEDRVRADVDRHPGEQRWREIEVEDLAGDGVVAAALDSSLTRAGITPSDTPSKLYHALTAADGDARRLLEPVEEGVLHGYLRAQLRRLLLADVDVRREVPESVHQMRKACRRLRSALRAYAPQLGPTARTEALETDLQWLGRQLSEARDVEVQRARLLAGVTQAPPAPGQQDAHARLEAYFTERAEQARDHVVTVLGSGRYLGLLDALERLLGDGGAPDLSRRDAARALRRLAKKVSARAEGVETATTLAERDAAVHRVRKGAKRLRYALEVAAPLAPKKTARALSRFDDLQDMLGEFQDSVVARHHLAEATAQDGTSASAAFVLGAAYQREADIAEAQVRRLGKDWTRARKRVKAFWA